MGNIVKDEAWLIGLVIFHLFVSDIKLRPASHTWRSIVGIKAVLEKGIKWVIGEHTKSNKKVEELNVKGRWNLDSISHIVNVRVIDSLLGITLSHIKRGRVQMWESERESVSKTSKITKIHECKDWQFKRQRKLFWRIMWLRVLFLDPSFWSSHILLNGSLRVLFLAYVTNGTLPSYTQASDHPKTTK